MLWRAHTHSASAMPLIVERTQSERGRSKRHPDVKLCSDCDTTLAWGRARPINITWKRVARHGANSPAELRQPLLRALGSPAVASRFNIESNDIRRQKSSRDSSRRTKHEACLGTETIVYIAILGRPNPTEKQTMQLSFPTGPGTGYSARRETWIGSWISSWAGAWPSLGGRP